MSKKNAAAAAKVVVYPSRAVSRIQRQGEELKEWTDWLEDSATLFLEEFERSLTSLRAEDRKLELESKVKKAQTVLDKLKALRTAVRDLRKDLNKL
jgi:hypothetical protein